MSQGIYPSQTHRLVRIRHVEPGTARLWELAKAIDAERTAWAQVLRTTEAPNGECEVLLAVHKDRYQEITRGRSGIRDKLAAIGCRFHEDSWGTVELDYARSQIARLLVKLEAEHVGRHSITVSWSVVEAAAVLGTVSDAVGIARDVRFTPVVSGELDHVTLALTLPKEIFDEAHGILASGRRSSLADSVFLAIDLAASREESSEPMEVLAEDDTPY